MKISYRLRPGTAGVSTIYCRITANKVRCKSDFSTNLKVRPANWCRATYRSKADPLVNKQLELLEQDIFAVYLQVRKYLQHPTGEDIKQAFLSETKGAITLVNVSELVLQQVERKFTARTLEKNRNYHNHLKNFFGPEILPGSINEQSAVNFFTTLRRSVGHNHAGRCVSYLKRCIEFAWQQGYCRANPLASYSIRREYPEEPEHLSQRELARLQNFLFVSDRLAWCRDLFVFMANTGMDLADVFTFNKTDLRSSGGVLIIDRKREKNGCRYVVPVNATALALLEKYGFRFQQFTEQYYNRLLKQACYTAEIADYERISSRWARKTAAMHWINGLKLSTEVVSLMLGHKSTRTTEKHYIKVQAVRVVEEWLKKAG